MSATGKPGRNGLDIAPKVEKVSPLDVELDPCNPRLAVEEEGSSQAQLIEIALDRFNLDELAESIIATGYRPFDPIVGYKHHGNLRILEGNRRVATLKLLLDPTIAPERHRSRWEQYANQLGAARMAEIRSINVHVFPERDAVGVTAYIGYRHVTGVMGWPPLEKAKFIARLVEDLRWSYEDVGERLGIKPKQVERHYVAHQVVRQAKDLDLPGAENLEQAFGVLLRALQAKGISEFLGVTYPSNPARSRVPVPSRQRDNLRSFVEWTFGTEDRRRLLQDSRDLTKWGRILSSSAAVAYLRRAANPTFDRAWIKSGGIEESILEALLSAADRLEESVSLVPAHRKNPEVQDAVDQCAFYLTQILAHFPDLQGKYRLQIANV